MSSTLQVVSPNDLSTVIFDLNDPTGANSALYGSVTTEIVGDVDWGHPEPTDITISRRDPDFYTKSRATCGLGVVIKATSVDNLTLAAGMLSEQFSRGCVLKWIPSGSANTRYIDTVPSNTPALLDGRALGLYEVATLNKLPTGILLQFQRYPFLRAGKLDPTSNKLVTNPTMIRDSNDDGTPDGWTKISTPTLTIDATQNSLHVVAGAAARGVYQTTAAASASSGQTWTLAFDLKVTSGTVGVSLNWRTNADADISSTTLTFTNAGWVRVAVSGSAPATTDRIRATIQSSGAAATFDTRNCKIELAATATDFCVVAETVNMDPAAAGFNKNILVYNPGTGPSPCVLTSKLPDASSAVTEIDYGLLADDGAPGTEFIADYLNATHFAQADASGNGWIVTLGLETTATAVTGSSGGNSARVAHTTDATVYNKRVTLTRTTRLDSLRGRWTVYARALGNSALTTYFMQLRWSTGTTALETLDEVPYLPNGVVAGSFHLVPLGEIEIPQSQNVTLGQLTMELWTHTDVGVSNLDIDYLFFVPSYQAITTAATDTASVTMNGSAMVSPPFRATSAPSDPVWVVNTGGTSGTAIVLLAVNEAAGAGSNANGLITGSGAHHVTTFDIQFALNVGMSCTTAWGIADITDNDKLDSSGTTTQFSLASAGPFYSHFIFQVGWSDEINDKYQPRVGFTAAGGTPVVYVNSITDVIVDAAVQNQQIRTDPGSEPIRNQVEKLDTNGNLARPWNATRVPFWIPPGLSCIWIEALDAVSLGATLASSINTRTLTVTPTIYPRYWA